jgi:hypothetical protein
MAVAKRKRRRIVVNGRSFVWYVTDGPILMSYRLPDGTGMLVALVIHIISEDKKFNVSYGLNQQDLPEPYLPHLFVLGHEFPGVQKAPTRIAVPRWYNDSISSKFVHDIIVMVYG